MSFLKYTLVVHFVCAVVIIGAHASSTSQSDPTATTNKLLTRNFQQSENDPESYYVSPASRSKREAKPPHKLDAQKIKQNSTMTHVSNTTMMEILSNFSNRQPTSSSHQSMAKNFTLNKLNDSGRLRRQVRNIQSPIDSAEKEVVVRVSRSTYDAVKPNDLSTKMGDMESLIKEQGDDDDLVPAANYNSKKYVLVKKKPKHKKIKMEVFEPKMKYKKIKMKVPVKKMKKKKVKGYLVKKEKHYHHA